ncbi:MAG: ATP-dependent Clp protease proteolytic subunit [Thiomargarita sp.]|nr:ATP-dependent Clp protease proteolytic subunit [Thiomargarita sp.]
MEYNFKSSHLLACVSLVLLTCVNVAQATDIELLKEQLAQLKVHNAIQQEKLTSDLLALQTEKKTLKLLNDVQAEKVRQEVSRLTAETKKLGLENKRFEAQKKKKLSELVMQNAIQAEYNKQEELKLKLVKAQLAFEKSKLTLQKAKIGLELTELTNEISKRKKKRILDLQVNKPPEYLKLPFINDRLIISDRKITLDKVIVQGTAKYVTERIHYYNNKNTEYPIFLVIDRCYGGSVMEGVKILEAIEDSQAPVYVVVQSFAASMAAVITTLAEHSYAYPNAILLHHQISSIIAGNQTQLTEYLKITDKWTQRILLPVAQKMGISMTDFVTKMYEHNSTGDWQEFADVAVTYKWVNKIVTNIVDLSFVTHPDSSAKKSKKTISLSILETEKIDPQGHRYVELPLLNPMDVYYLYNPGNYYR